MPQYETCGLVHLATNVTQPQIRPFSGFLLVMAIILLTGCQKPESSSVELSYFEQVRANIDAADLSVLFIGNSHASPLPRELESVSSVVSPSRKMFCQRAPLSGFLIKHVEDAETLAMIDAGPWDFVVLQAQRYSASGRPIPTDSAIELANKAKSIGAKVVMFPEWSRKSLPNEYLMIDKIHDGIAEHTGAQVAPIGITWKNAGEKFPDVKLHCSDGNHAAKHGIYLNACVFYGMLTGESPVMESDEITVAGSTSGVLRRQLAEIAWESVQQLVTGKE